MVIIIGNEINDPSSTLDKAISVSLYANSLRRGMNPSLLLLAMSKEKKGKLYSK